MNRKQFGILAAVTVAVLAAGVWISLHRASQQSDLNGASLFADLKPALGEISEIRLSKGDGSRTTLKKGADGWTVAERQYPADAGRIRELAMSLANLKIVERKTSDPANYAKLGVEPPDTPTATSTLVEVVAGKKTWSLIVGRGGDAGSVYVRKPAEAESLLAQPLVAADPDQKRWLDRLVTDIAGSNVHDISVKTAGQPAYLLTRAERGATELALSPVPKGRTQVGPMSLNGQAEALASLHFDDVRAQSASAATADRATYRTFDGQVIELAGHREGDKAYVSVKARRDAELAAKFSEPAAAPAATTADQKPAADKTSTPTPATAPAAADKPVDRTVERLERRAQGLEYEIPAYKYEAIFKKPEELLEKPEKK
jgi:hypothetical protein